MEEVSALTSANPKTVAAVALATLAAAIGPKTLLIRGRHRYTPGFNVVVSHHCPRTLTWMDALMAPFLGRVFDLQTNLARRGASAIHDENLRRQRELGQVHKTIGPSPDLVAQLEAEIGCSDARLQPFVATSGVAPKELAGLLPRAFDDGVTRGRRRQRSLAPTSCASNRPERAHLAQLAQPHLERDPARLWLRGSHRRRQSRLGNSGTACPYIVGSLRV